MNIQESAAPIESAESHFIRRYTALRDSCRPELWDEDKLLKTVRELEVHIATTYPSDPKQMQSLFRLRRNARRAINTILNRAPSLSESGRQTVSAFRDQQPEFVDDRYKFTLDYSDNYATQWPAIFSGLSGRPDLTFLEIGSLEGMSACWFLKNVLTHPTSRLICIDLFLQTAELEDGPAFDTYIDSEGRSTFERFIYNIRLTDASNRVTVLQEASSVALRNVPLGSLDAAYVDGSHHATDVLQDAVLTWGLLKPGGIMLFDDYAWRSPFSKDQMNSPKPAIDCFLAIFDGHYRELYRGVQVAIQKQ